MNSPVCEKVVVEFESIDTTDVKTNFRVEAKGSFCRFFDVLLNSKNNIPGKGLNTEQRQLKTMLGSTCVKIEKKITDRCSVRSC